MEPWNLSYFLPRFFPNYLYSTVHLIFPVHCVCSFHSTFSSWAASFISACPSSVALLTARPPPHFPVFLNRHSSLLCLEQVIPTTITWPFLSTIPTGTVSFFWCSCKAVVRIGERKVKMQIQHQREKEEILLSSVGTFKFFTFVNCKSQALRASITTVSHGPFSFRTCVL